MRLESIGYGFVALFFIAVAVDARRYGHVHTGDSDNLVRGARVAVECLRGATFRNCGHLQGSVQTLVYPYPLLQYIPASLFVWLRFTDDATLKWLAILNLMAVAGTLVAVVRVFRARPRLRALLVVALTGSSLLYQSTSAFGEALSACALVAAVLAAISRRPWLLLVFTALASLGKETLPPFVVLLVLSCCYEANTKLLPPKRFTLTAVAGGLAGIALNAGFNLFRFGSPRNLLYLDPPQHTPGIARKAEFFAALWASPTAGIAWFWPVATAVLVATVGVTARRLMNRRDWPVSVATAGVSLSIIIFLAGLSLWYSPFGWIAYGPRLVVPVLPGALVAAVHLLGETFLAQLDRLRMFAVVLMPIVFLGITQYGSPWRWRSAVEQLISADQACPRMTELNVYTDRATYYRCSTHFMWRIKPAVLDDLWTFGFSLRGAGWMFGAAGALALCVVVLKGRRPIDDTGPRRDRAATTEGYGVVAATVSVAGDD